MECPSTVRKREGIEVPPTFVVAHPPAKNAGRMGQPTFKFSRGRRERRAESGSSVPRRCRSEKGSECHRRSWRPILPQRTREEPALSEAKGMGNHIKDLAWVIGAEGGVEIECPATVRKREGIGVPTFVAAHPPAKNAGRMGQPHLRQE
jgi:hypothetical protein